LVVEHDKDMILNADYVIDMGPAAGVNGGTVVAQGTPDKILKSNSLTAQYLNGKKEVAIPATRRKGNGLELSLKGATGNNLRNVDVDFPLGKMILVSNALQEH